MFDLRLDVRYPHGQALAGKVVREPVAMSLIGEAQQTTAPLAPVHKSHWVTDRLSRAFSGSRATRTSPARTSAADPSAAESRDWRIFNARPRA